MTAPSFTEGPAPPLPRRAPQDYCKLNKPGSGFRAGVVSRSSRMPNDVQAAILNSPKPEALYGKLEDRILARDQKGASDVYYDLVRQRPPMPEVVWPDQEPEHLEGPLQDRLDHWMTLVHRGNVLEAYRVFLGLMQNPAERKEVLAHLLHAGLMDVQDRALYNRSYTTGHKAFRARATVELGNFLGWDNAHNVIYAGALDVAVGPRWYSTYEMACNIVKIFLE